MRSKLSTEDKQAIVEYVTKLRSNGLKFREITPQVNYKFNTQLTTDAINTLHWRYGSEDKSNIDFTPIDERGINEDGVYRDARYFEVDINEPMGVNDMLLAHGLDPTKWEVVTTGSTGSKIGTSGNDEQYFINTYRKLTARPKIIKITHEDLLQILRDTKIDPIHIEPRSVVNNHDGLYEIPIFDAHFGIAKYEDYKTHQAEIYRYIRSQGWAEILFIIGQDLFHNDDFRGRTSKGTPIERADIEQAVKDAKAFYYPLIEEAIQQSLKVKIVYSRGNHDESFGWWFVNLLAERYPQIEVDGEQSEYKKHVYHDVFLGYNHGEKVRNDLKLIRTFNGLWRLEMAQAKVRIIKRGHYHTMSQLDDDGTILMGLGTSVPTDEYHHNHGYTYTHKTFQTFIYNKHGIKAQIYINGQ